MTIEPSRPPIPDDDAAALEACVLYLARYLERPLTRAALREVLPDPGIVELDGRSSAVRAAMAAARRAGLRAAFGRRAITAIEPALLPAVLIPPDGDPVVLHQRKGTRLILHDPRLGAGLIEQPTDALGTGAEGEVHVLSLKPEFRDSPTSGRPEPQGHWLRGALAANRWTYVQVALAAALVNSLGLVVSLFSMVVYDRVLPSAATDSLVALAIGVGIALTFDFMARSLRAGFIDHAGQRADIDMGQRLFDHLVDTRMRARRGSVGQVAAAMREMETLRDFFTSATMTAVVDLPFVLLFVAAVAFLAGTLAIIPAIAVVAVLVIGVAIQPALGRLSDRILAEGQSKQTVLVETLTGIETVKAIGAGRQMRARWGEALRRQSFHAVQSRALTQGAINATSFVQQLAQVLIIVFGAIQVLSGQITAGVLIAAVILTGRALAPLGLIAQTLTRVNQTRSAYRSLEALMRAEAEHPLGQTWLSRSEVAGALRFEGVRFTYPGQERAALDGISFTIAPGERVAVMGAVGSGKSTITRLALGLHTPDEGVIQLDGVDLRQIDPADLRSHFGVVLQDNWLVSGTLRENIALGTWRASDAAILRAARLAGVEKFAAAHPSGYGMSLTEGGGGLSGGQRQMVALARALVSDPRILILDEPTAALDIHSERALIAELRKALHGRTLIVMTHRTSLLDLVDRVIVLERGRIKADGQRQTGGANAPAVRAEGGA